MLCLYSIHGYSSPTHHLAHLLLQFAAIFSWACLISGAFGAAGLSKLVQKLGRPSILVVLMAGVATLATILTGISKGGQGVQDLINGHNIGFKPFCQ